MNKNSGIFVKLNYKNIGELNSFIYDKTNGVDKNRDKYVMCAGKYDKSGWTIVFQAKTISEAEELVSRNKRKRNQIMQAQIAESNEVLLPSWM